MQKKPTFKIAVYCDHWQNGGVEAYLMNLFRFWNREKLDCELVVSQWETDLYDNELAELGILHKVTLSKQYRSPILRILNNLSAVRRLFQGGDYDAVYLNLSNSFTMIYAWLAKRANIPIRVVHSHCAGIRPGITYPIKWVGHQLGRALFLSSVTQYFACSELAARWIFGDRLFENNRVQLINNAVDTEAFAFRPEERDSFRAQYRLEGKRVIGTVGRFSKEKNPFFLLDVFAQLAKIDPDAFLLWVGEGELMEDVQARAREIGIADRILFFGKTNQVARCLWAMDVFCLPSRFEGLGIALIEAQAAGCVCLASDCIPVESKVNDNLSFIPINQGTEPWVKAIQSAERVCDYSLALQQVLKHGYDAALTSKNVQEQFANVLLHSGDKWRAGV